MREVLLAAVAAGALTGLVACGEREEQHDDGHVYVTKMLGECTYDAAHGGIVFEFSITGDEDADMVAEVHRAARGADEHHPGPVIASAVHKVRGGAYENPITVVVPLEEHEYDAERTRCILQTENYGPDVIHRDGRRAAP